MDITKELFSLQDLEYRKFHKKLCPTVDEDLIIGIRVPVLRKFATKIFGTKEAEEFMQKLPHKYCEENDLHAFLAEKIKDFDTAVKECERFLPYIDNWATCDSYSPKVFAKNTEKLYPYILKWVKSDKTYTIRFGIEMLMSFYLDDKFSPEHLAVVASVKSEEYYVNMMIAWYFATALTKQYDATVRYIENEKLPKWVHNKAIQKAIESRRISDEIKNYLRTKKIK